MQDEVCRRLSWDSDFFGLRIARLVPLRLTPDTVAEAEAWCLAERIDCLYFLADADDPCTVSIAEDHHFRLFDVRVTLAQRVLGLTDMQADSNHVRRFRPEDEPALRSLARVSHRSTRFYADPNFPASLCDALYETWIEKSCHGYADAVFVADSGAGPAGYATAHRDSASEGRLGLIAVSPESRGLGLGKSLTAAVCDWSRHEGLQELSVVTQGRNVGALRLYARCGFLPQSLQLWYHRWFSSPSRRDLP